jgi:REP element-mobilizing transposase RayT
MPQSLTQLYVHLVFSTKNRTYFINEKIANDLYSYIGGTLNKLGCQPLKIGGVEDHIHILCCLSKNITIIKLLQEIKQSSSKWLKTKADELRNFYWQDGYGAFTVSPANVENLISYIGSQREHHLKKSFKEEYIEFLEGNDIQYDLRYV